MNDIDFADKAQGFLSEEVINELGQMIHRVNIEATCEAHMLLSYVIDYGVNVLASQIGMDEVKSKVWPTLQQMAKDVNEQHVHSLAELRAKYPVEFAEAETQALKSDSDRDRKLALLREMLGQVEK